MRTDYTQTSEQIFLDMVNDHNRESLTEQGLYPIQGRDVVLGVPTALTQSHTSVTVTSKQTAPFVDRFRFYYNRVPLNRLLLHDADTAFRVRAPGEYRLSDFIDRINQRWQINLGVRDYVDQSVIIEQYDATVMLVADPRSFVWVGSLPLRISCGLDLSDVVIERNLDGFGDNSLRKHITNTNLDGFIGGQAENELTIPIRNLDGFS